MSVRMIVTTQSITRREKSRRRFRHWWRKKASPESRMAHLMVCGGCVGCNSILDEISNYPEEE